ncbi:MAG: hypothetical protein JSS11_09075 [Verrucomicrobia bacterium]|nr:hypothetical protein [Verrucomicrobiota bacterium]
MPALPLQTDAFVLARRQPTDSFQTFSVFTVEHGALLILHRVPKKNSATTVALDLFDEVSLLLESSNQGQTWFVKEARLITRHAGLGRSYATLAAASDLAKLITRNAVQEEGRATVATLLRTALAALAAGAPPAVVWLKSLYSFARDEGYPVKQQWLPTLPADLRTTATHLLHTPLAELEKSAHPEAASLAAHLATYLRSHAELHLD